MEQWRRRATAEQRWAYLRSVEPDVALLQEAAPSQENLSGWDAAPDVPWQIDTNRRWGSGVLSRWPVRLIDEVVTKYGKKSFRLHTDDYYRGALAVAEVDAPGGPITFVSLYALMKPYYAQTTLARMAADLIPLFDSGTARQIVIGGDFNMHTAARKPDERRRAYGLLGLYESLGLVDLFKKTGASRGPLQGCPCSDDPCTHVRTHLHDKQRGSSAERVGGHNDYLYATPDLANRLVDIHVPGDTDEDVWDLSDHSPLIATFDIT
jgi:exonuclease III